MNEITDNLARAFDRIGDFQSVQSDVSATELREAVECLQEAVGIREDERALIAERLEEIRDSNKASGHVLLGVIIGLMTAEARSG